MKPEQNQALRNSGMTGSDASVAMGANSFENSTTRVGVKRGEITPENISAKESVTWGLAHEETVAKQFAKRMGFKIQMLNRTFRSKEWPIAHGHLDAKIVGKPWLLEVKTTSEYNNKSWGKEFTEEIPPAYYYQILHYLYISGYEKAYCAVLIGGNKMRIYEIKRNEERIEELIAAEKKFWYDYVIGGETPPPQSSEEALLQFPAGIEDTPLLANPMTIQLHAAVKQLDEEIKEKKFERERMATELMAHMKAHTLLVTASGDNLVTWKNSTRRNKDNKAIEAALSKHEDTSQYINETSVRTFKIV
jgi:putative phage-type endonuclease